MTTSIDELLPCPFCGDVASVETHAADEGWSGNERRIVCRNKECFGPATAWYGDDEARIAAWNRRSAIASRQAVVTPTMWAEVIEDPFSGQIVWLCSEDGNKGDDTTEPLLELFANTFPVGTRIEIAEPVEDRALSHTSNPEEETR